jgi:thiol-disulfide isomerase/thioredoxin
MRKVIAAILLAACPLACGAADDKKDEPKKGKLNVGDTAPPLKVTQWMNGEDPKAFDKDKVYVLEFWATWCGPCIRAMPHLTELQKEFKGKGLVVVGLTNKDEIGNTKESVTKFVAKSKAKVGYVMGYSDGDENWKAYMEAAGQEGIPCSYVVGKDGKIAYIGHPMYLDVVLPKVLAGTWTKADADATEKMDAEFKKVFGEDNKPADMLAKLVEFAKAHPEMAKTNDVRQMHFALLMETKKWDEAKALADDLIAASEAGKKAMPAVYAIGLANVQANPDKKHFDVGLKALETALKFDDKDVGILLTAAQVFTSAGDKDKAAAFGKKAVEAAPDEDDKKQVQRVVDDILKGGK